MSEDAVFQYMCDNLDFPAEEGAIAWNDSMLGIDWFVPYGDITLSEKDKRHPLLSLILDMCDYSVDYYLTESRH